jgi:hypothetical protein
MNIEEITMSNGVESARLSLSPKYESIRQRFLDSFYYAGHVAVSIEDDHITFGDQTIYMGQALIFLASELYIRRKIGMDPGPALDKIQEILTALDQLDLAAEPLFGYPPAIDGFIARDNITGPDDPRLGHRFTKVSSDWKNPEDAAPSGDQIFGLLNGMLFLVRLSEDSTIIDKAKEVSDRVFQYAQRFKFQLRLPNGDFVKRGSDMRALSSIMHGLNYAITGKDRFNECRIEVKLPLVGLKDVDLKPIASFWDQVGERAAEIMRSNVTIPLLGEFKINSYAEHMLLMAIAPSDIWSKEEFEKAALAVNHHLAVLVYALFHGAKPDSFGLADIQAILDRCPDNGPRSDLPVKTGWQKDNRWIRCSSIDTPESGQKIFNGIDFLMLYNLAEIVFRES